MTETSGIDQGLIGNPVQFDPIENVFTVDVSSGYDFLNASDEVVATQNYTVSSKDAEDVSGTIEVKISGAEDISTITGVPSDVITLTPSQLTATGDLDVTDLDRTDSTFNTIPSTLPVNGNFVIDGDGNWDFTVSLQELVYFDMFYERGAYFPLVHTDGNWLQFPGADGFQVWYMMEENDNDGGNMFMAHTNDLHTDDLPVIYGQSDDGTIMKRINDFDQSLDNDIPVKTFSSFNETGLEFRYLDMHAGDCLIFSKIITS